MSYILYLWVEGNLRCIEHEPYYSHTTHALLTNAAQRCATHESLTNATQRCATHESLTNAAQCCATLKRSTTLRYSRMQHNAALLTNAAQRCATHELLTCLNE